MKGESRRTSRPETSLASGPVELRVVFSPPPGQKLDERYGPATRVVVSATPPELLLDGAGTGTDLHRNLVLNDDIRGGVLHVAAMAASCDDDETAEFPACHVHQQDWGVPVALAPSGESVLTLFLAGRQ